MISLDRLQTWLNQSNLQQTNNPLWQVISALIKAAQEFQNEQAATNTAASGAITGLENADFLTHTNEAILLPNSRQLLAGTNVTFDDTIVNERTVNVSIVEREWSVLTNGDPDYPEVIFVGGDVVMIHTP